jgi:hypothetical protein
VSRDGCSYTCLNGLCSLVHSQTASIHPWLRYIPPGRSAGSQGGITCRRSLHSIASAKRIIEWALCADVVAAQHLPHKEGSECNRLGTGLVGIGNWEWEELTCFGIVTRISQFLARECGNRRHPQFRNCFRLVLIFEISLDVLGEHEKHPRSILVDKCTRQSQARLRHALGHDVWAAGRLRRQ